MTRNCILTYVLGVVVASTLLPLVQTDSSIENTGSLILPDHPSYSFPSIERIVDSRFNLLAANFQGQIDVLQTKVIRLENSKVTQTEKIKGKHQRGIQKRQTDTSKPKRPINFQNINSSCTFFYPDYPDHFRINRKISSTAANQIETPKSTRPICENSSSFCTFLHPDHPNVAPKNDKNLNKNSPTVSHENLQDAKNENELPTIYSATDYPKTDYPKTDRKMSETTPVVTNEVFQGNTKVKGMPTSCTDLQHIGHKLNGLYLIKTPRQNNQGMKIEVVFCDFPSPLGVSAIQNLIGSVKITTKNTFFYAQRHGSFSAINAVIPWELERLNEGGAFNLASGVFTAPVPGIYHFEFHGFKDNCIAYLDIILQLNGDTYAAATTGVTDSPDTLSLSATLRLKAGDRVNMFNWKNGNSFPSGVLFDIAHLHVTHFSGWLLEEDLM